MTDFPEFFGVPADLKHLRMNDPVSHQAARARKKRCFRKMAGAFILLFLSVYAPIRCLGETRSPALSSITGPCNLSFPSDHGAHPNHRTEWWYYTGNLRSRSGLSYGYQLTFFRTRIAPPDSAESRPSPHSAWRAQHVYMGHGAVSCLSRGAYVRSERMARQALGLADVLQQSGAVTIHVEDWQARITSNVHQLKATADAFSLELTLRPLKKPVMHGDMGYSRKGLAAEKASCYYSFTRLDTRGTLSINGETVFVEGLSWMDHEFSTAPLEKGIVGWDWFSIQLDDGTELMLYLLRLDHGAVHSASSGTFIGPEGETRHLKRSEFQVDVLETWQSPHSEAVYPSRWRVTVFPLSMTLWIDPSLDDQEMHSPKSTNITYWEGSVSIEANVAESSVKGNGYVEMTGYAKPFDAPM